MIALLLILIPLFTGLAGFLIRDGENAKKASLISSIATLLVSLTGLALNKNKSYLDFDVEWLTSLNSRFHVGLDGMGQLLCLLTAIAFPIIFIATWRTESKPALRMTCQPVSRLNSQR